MAPTPRELREHIQVIARELSVALKAAGGTMLLPRSGEWPVRRGNRDGVFVNTLGY